MEMMPVVPMAVESVPTQTTSGASGQAGGEGSFESWMAAFSNMCDSKGAILPNLILNGAGSGKPFSPEELDRLLSMEDLDSLAGGDESIYAAMLASLSSGQMTGITSENAEAAVDQSASQVEVADVPELAAGAVLTTAVEGEETEAVMEAMKQVTQAKNDPAGSSVVQKLAANPNIPAAINHAQASDKALETAPVFDEALLAEEGSATQEDSGAELFKLLQETMPGKHSEHVKEALDKGSHAVKENGLTPQTSSVVDEPVVKLTEEVQSSALSDAPEAGFAEAIQNKVGQQDAQSSEVNVTHVSSGQEAGAKIEQVGKEFVNIREGVEYVRLPSGEMVDKYAVLDQVINHVSLRNAAEGKTLTIRMHPQELGELKLDLILEHDKVKVNIQTQTHMVQDVLEQHLPRLREALEAQGVKVGDMQLSLDSQQQQGFESFRHFNSGQNSSQQRFQFAGQDGNSRGKDASDFPSQEHLAETRNAAQSGLSLRI